MEIPRELRSQYEVMKKLGQGGMGHVFQVRNRSTSKIYAIKLLEKRMNQVDALEKRFLREAQLAKRDIHEAIVRSYDFGVADGISYIVYEYVEGHTLEEIIVKRRPLSVDKTLDYLLQLAQALAALHKEGIVHRDIKPSNIIIDEHEQLRLLDLGIARYMESGHSITETGMIIGTPHFLAPELISGKKVLPSADIYAVGALGIDCLSASSPFGDWQGMVVNKLNERAAGLGRLAIPPICSGELAELLRRATSFDPHLRFQDGQALLQALQNVHSPNGSALNTEDGLTKSAVSPLPALPATKERRPSKKAPYVIFLFILVLLLHFNPFTASLDTTVQALQVIEGVDFVEVRWTSKEPYVGRVELLPEEGKVQRAVEAAATTSHVVLIERVPPNTAGRLTICFPSGERSLAHKYVTKDKALTLLSAKRTSDGLEISFLSRPKGQRANLVMASGKKIKGHRLDDKWIVNGGKTKDSVSLARATISVLGRGGLEHEFSLRDRLRQQVLRASVSLQTKKAKRMYIDALIESKKKKKDFKEPDISSRDLVRLRVEAGKSFWLVAKDNFNATGDAERLETITALSPLAFSPMLDIPEQATLLKRLIYYRKLKSLLLKFKDEPLFREPYCGHFHYSSRRQGEKSYALKLSRERKIKLMEGLDKRREADPLWMNNFELASTDLTGCELKFTIGHWRAPWLALNINDNNLIIPSPRLISAWRRLRVSKVRELKTVYQRIPPSYLVKGKNFIELRVDSVERIGNIVTIDKIELLLYYK